MPGFAELLSQGSEHAWLFIPSAILLGALHGLEPGHSKTMMAAFIVAIRGTVTQAALLGIAATVSHTAVVWGIAFAGMYLWRGVDAESVEPYFQLASAAIIIAIALWMLWRTWQDQRMAKAAAGHSHGAHHGSHSHSGQIILTNTRRNRAGTPMVTYAGSIPAMASSRWKSLSKACRRFGGSGLNGVTPGRPRM